MKKFIALIVLQLFTLNIFGSNYASGIQPNLINTYSFEGNNDITGLSVRASINSMSLGRFLYFVKKDERVMNTEIYSSIVEKYITEKENLSNNIVENLSMEKPVKLISSYSPEYKVFIKENKIFLPAMDGVIRESDVLKNMTYDKINTSLCGSELYTCENIYDKDVRSMDQKSDIVVLIASNVEFAGNVETSGRSLFIISDKFIPNHFDVITTPKGDSSYKDYIRKFITYSGNKTVAIDENGTTTKMIRKDGQWEEIRTERSGRDGEDGGSFILFTNIMLGTSDVDARGHKGENGTSGLDAELINPRYEERETTTDGGIFDFDHTTVERRCFHDGFNQYPTDGGYAGNGGDSGDVLIYYNYKKYNKKQKDVITAIECFSNSCGQSECSESYMGFCGSDFIANPPENTTGAEEMDDETCSDGIDNDGDGLIDCKDTECKYSPVVTVCGSGENTVEACSDGIDNDNDGYTDCRDWDCNKNPYVKICKKGKYTFAKEGATNETCSDGIDNDGDGFFDCEDYSCQNNPAVTHCSCEVYSELKEIRSILLRRVSTSEKISMIENMGLMDSFKSFSKSMAKTSRKGFIEERNGEIRLTKETYEIAEFIRIHIKKVKRNPVRNFCDGEEDVVSISFENSVEKCTDGIDNDGDGRVDCNDYNCSKNPFFGARVCDNMPQTYHRTEDGNRTCYQKFNSKGNYLKCSSITDDFNISFSTGGEGGNGGNDVKVIVREIDTDTCYMSSTTGECVPRYEYITCDPKITFDGVNGSNGKEGFRHIAYLPLRSINKFKALVSPYHWRVMNIYGNYLYRKSDLEKASFYYTYNTMYLGKVAVDNDIDCGLERDDPTNLIYDELSAAVCPVLADSLTKLSGIANNVTYFGTADKIIINPAVRVADLIEKFEGYHDILYTRMTTLENLQNAKDISKLMSIHEGLIDVELEDVNADIEIAGSNMQKYQRYIDDLNGALNQRSAYVSQLNSSIDNLSTVIADKYAAQVETFGEFVAGTAAAAGLTIATQGLGATAWPYLKDAMKLEEAAGSVGEAVKEEVKKGFSKFADDVYENSKSALDEKGYLNDALSRTGDEIWKTLTNEDYDMTSNEVTPSRSVVVDEVEMIMSDHHLQDILLEMIDIQAELTKAGFDLHISQLEKMKFVNRRQNLKAMKGDIQNYRNYCQGESQCMTDNDKKFLYQKNFEYILHLLDKLPSDYIEILKYIEYEVLPYEVNSGENYLNRYIDPESISLRLENYTDLHASVLELENEIKQSEKNEVETYYYHRWSKGTENFIQRATEWDIMGFKEIGFMKENSTKEADDFYLFKENISSKDIKEDSNMNGITMQKVIDVKLNILTNSGQRYLLTAYLTRNPNDYYYLGDKNSEEEMYVEFDIYKKIAEQNEFFNWQQINPTTSPLNCTVADENCVSDFQVEEFDKTGNIYENRSLIGSWTVVVEKDEMAKIESQGDEIEAVEIKFLVSGTKQEPFIY